MTTILINNCGSQAVEIIRLLKQDKSIKVIYLTYTDKDKYLEVADMVLDDYKEVGIDVYLDFLYKLFKEYQVDVFVPFNRLTLLASHKLEIENKGVKVLTCSDFSLLSALNSKSDTYELLRGELSGYIPFYVKVRSLAELRNACQFIKDKGKAVCIKYAEDIAANSFRIINFDKRNITELDVKSIKEAKKLTHMLDYDTLLEMFMSKYGNNEFDRDLLVMEYLEGKEVSCDCLKLCDGRNIVVIRYKESENKQKIIHDVLIQSLCEKILDMTGYDGPCNIQFKYDENNRLKLLEVNTRMSGGVMITSWATNINLPLIAVKNKLGKVTEGDLAGLDYKEILFKRTESYKLEEV